jgi:hypothetical protein
MKKTVGFCLFVVIAIFCCLRTAGQELPRCVRQKIDQALLSSDLDVALKMTEACVIERRKDLADAEQKYKGQPVTLVDVVGLAEVGTGAVLIARAEVLALRGEVRQADSALLDVEAFIQQHPHANFNSILGGFSLDVARAFVLEKKGDLSGAERGYRGVLAAFKQSGSVDYDSAVKGRLAIVAFLRGDDAAAESLARTSLSSPAANAALASVLAKKGDDKAAKTYYMAAWELMSDAASKSNRSPIYFADVDRVKNGMR